MQSVPALAGLLTSIDRVHQQLHDTQPLANEPALTQLQTDAAEADQEHDEKIRGTHMLLSALALLADDQEQAAAYIALRDLLLPEGLSQIQKSYRGEAGAAELLVTRLGKEPAVAEKLEGIAAGSKNLAHHVGRWIACARRLGGIEDKRAQLQSKHLAGGGQMHVDARNGWIRTINTLLTVAEVAQLSEADDKLLFEPLRAAQRRADRRRGRGHNIDAEPTEHGGQAGELDQPGEIAEPPEITAAAEPATVASAPMSAPA